MSNDYPLLTLIFIALNLLLAIALPLVIRFGFVKRGLGIASSIGIAFGNVVLVVIVADYAYAGGSITPISTMVVMVMSCAILVTKNKAEREADKADKGKRKAKKAELIELLKSIGLFVVGFPIGVFIAPEPQGASMVIAGIVGGMSMVFLVGFIKGYRQKKPKAEKAEKKEQKKSGQWETGWPSPEEQSPNASQKKEGSRWKGRVVALLILFLPLIAILLYGLMQTQNFVITTLIGGVLIVVISLILIWILDRFFSDL